MLILFLLSNSSHLTSSSSTLWPTHLVSVCEASLLLLGLGGAGVSPGNLELWFWGVRNGGQSSRIFCWKLKGLTFFIPLSSLGVSSRTPSDKPVAHVVGKSSEDESGGEEADMLWRDGKWG